MRPVLLVTLCLLGLVGAGWAVVSEIGRSPGPTVKATPTPSTSSPTANSDGLVSPEVRACTEAVKSGDDAVGRARTAVGDWAAHVQAMTDQLSGKNTEAETEQVWAKTRARGPGRIAAFRSAEQAYRRARDGCRRRIPAEQVAPDAAATVATCRDVTRQADEVLVTARAAVADWAAHLQAMADRKAGRLSPHHAWMAWLDAYRSAPGNIDKFQAADRVYQDHARCGPPSTNAQGKRAG